MKNKLQQLLQNGNINEYFHDALSRRSKIVSEQQLAEIVEQAQAMTQAGVCSDNDHCQFSLIMMHAKPIAEDIAGRRLSPEDLAEVSDIIYKGRNDRKINDIPNFFKAVHHALQEMKLPMKKMAYPQSYLGIYVYPAYDISKWMNSVKEIYAMSQKRNIDLSQSFKEVTDKWEDREKRDFSHWMRFYSSQSHQKYKTAQKYFAPEVTDDQQEGRGYFVPMYNNQDIKANVPGFKGPQMPDMSNMGGANQERIEQEQQAAKDTFDRKERDKLLRGKVVARLTSAEKLLSCDDGRDLVGTDLARLLETLHALKRNVLSLNVSAKTANDFIIREANRMDNDGLVKGAEVLYVLAQDPLGGMPPMPGMEAAPAPAEPEGPPQKPHSAIEVFKKRVRDGLLGANEVFIKDQEEEVNAPPEEPLPAAPEAPAEAPAEAASSEAPPEPLMPAQSGRDSEAAIIVEAQEPPPPAPDAPPAPPEPDAAIEVADDEIAEEKVESTSEDIVETALGQVTVDDVINRLENLAAIFKNREIARELAIVDMMMDKLGIAAYFPNLAEAMSKALESNQYSLTRIEDILNKVRGVAHGDSSIDLTPDREVSPESAKLQQSLEAVEDKELQRKERRKEVRERKEDAGIAAPEAPATPEEAAATKELREPATVETAAPTPIR